jgi:hypothetical protein
MPFGNDVGRVCEVQPMSDYEIVMVIIGLITLTIAAVKLGLSISSHNVSKKITACPSKDSGYFNA